MIRPKQPEPLSLLEAAIPVVALAVWWSLRRMHHKVFKD